MVTKKPKASKRKHAPKVEPKPTLASAPFPKVEPAPVLTPAPPPKVDYSARLAPTVPFKTQNAYPPNEDFHAPKVDSLWQRFKKFWF